MKRYIGLSNTEEKVLGWTLAADSILNGLGWFTVAGFALASSTSTGIDFNRVKDNYTKTRNFGAILVTIFAITKFVIFATEAYLASKVISDFPRTERFDNTK